MSNRVFFYLFIFIYFIYLFHFILFHFKRFAAAGCNRWTPLLNRLTSLPGIRNRAAVFLFFVSLVSKQIICSFCFVLFCFCFLFSLVPNVYFTAAVIDCNVIL